MLLAGQYEEGSIAANDAFAGPGGVKGREQRNRVDPYQPAGDLRFRMAHGDAQDYRRELDLATGIVTITYAADGAHYRREYLAHLEDDLLYVRLTADAPFTATFWLSRAEDADCFLTCAASDDSLTLDGHFQGGIGFRVEGRVLHCDGERRAEGEQLHIEGAREILLALNVGTSATGIPPITESRVPHTACADWATLCATHAPAYQRFYGGLDLNIDLPESTLPTDARIQAIREGGSDPLLPVLYMQYGRYLLVASSARAQLPPNLQGKWNEDIRPPWECDYHHDVNLQMNYWPAEAGNLAYTTEALFQHIERFMPHARKAARDLYGCRGVWFPIQTDAWGRATPESYGWAVWIGAAPWLAQHLWWRWEYGQDVAFLRDRAYPFFKEVAAFYEDYLLADAQGVLADRALAIAGEPLCGHGHAAGQHRRVGHDGRHAGARGAALCHRRGRDAGSGCRQARALAGHARAPAAAQDRAPRPTAGVERGLRRGRARRTATSRTWSASTPAICSTPSARPSCGAPQRCPWSAAWPPAGDTRAGAAPGWPASLRGWGARRRPGITSAT